MHRKCFRTAFRENMLCVISSESFLRNIFDSWSLLIWTMVQCNTTMDSSSDHLLHLTDAVVQKCQSKLFELSSFWHYLSCWIIFRQQPTRLGWIDRASLEMVTRSFHWAHLSRFHLKTGTESSHRNAEFLNRRQDDGKNLRGLSPRANYTDRATSACRRSDRQLLNDSGCHVVSVTDLYGRILGFLDRSRCFSIK
jgi:hypothetical protein